MLLPDLPIASFFSSSGTITKALCLDGSGILTITFLAGVIALLINSTGSLLNSTTSTFSPFSSFSIPAILEPFSPIHEPIGSILSLIDETATLERIPASRTTRFIIIVPFAISGISCSNNLLTKPKFFLDNLITGPFGPLITLVT